MKNMKIALCAILLTFSISSFARPNADKISDPVNRSFKQEFKNAEIMNCEISSNLTKLTFRMNDLVLYAFYSDQGELLAVTRNILTSQLPLNLMLNVRKNYKDYWVSDLFELTSKDDNAYYLTLENATVKVVLRSRDGDAWEVYNKTDKD